jgi:hypothetical protein
LQTLLCSQPVLAYPRADREYALITDASFGDENTAGGLGAILTQMDTEGRFYVIAYASRKLQKYEENYMPFLLEMQAAIFGMETFEVHLKGRHFKLFTDHKPLKKLGKVHTKTLNRLQQMMNLFSFDIIYKQGSEMPANFLSRNAVDAIQFDLSTYAQEQDKDELLRNLRLYLLNKILPTNATLSQLIYRLAQDCFVLNGVVWKRLGASHQFRSVLLVPQHLIPHILREAHCQFLAGHFGVSKTKERLLQSYYWPNMEKDILDHLQRCDRCQITRKNVASPELLLPLPQCTEPNQRVHADLFGPLKNADGNRKFILCVTDAFTNYVELVVLPNKEALTVATAILNGWICHHGLPLELFTNQGKEFTNKMAQHLFEALDVHHSTTASYHPQCNSQAEVCNKTIAQYLSAFVDEGTTNWELFVPALAFAYNTSYHRSVKATPFSLMFGLEARLPAFFASDFNRLHEGSEAGSHLARLLRARQLAIENNLEATDKQKLHYDATATHHVYHEGQFVLLEDFNFLNKNRKLAPKFSGPFRILRVKGDHNVELLLTNGCKIVVNVARIKPYLSQAATSHIGEPVASGDTPPSDTPPLLTLAHSRHPGRPRKILHPSDDATVDKKVLSPAPSVSFSNLGADLPVGGPPTRNETSVTRTHSMRTRSSAVTQDALSARLNVILSRNFHCVLDNPKKVPQKVSPRKLRVRRPLQMGTPYGDPYKYSDYPETAHYIDPPQPGIFNNVVGDGYFDDDEDDEQGFHFEDLIPILEDDSDDYDLEAAYNRYEADAGYRDEGEAGPQVPPQPPRQGEDNQPPVL